MDTRGLTQNQILKLPSHVENHVFVTVEAPGQPVKIRHWTGTCSVKRIHEAAKKHYQELYPGVKLGFGNAWRTYSWGAH
jgi:hypothetical protein